MNVIFRLNTNITGFENFKIAREFFLNILPIRDNNYFFNTKRLNQIELDDIIYFLYGKEIIDCCLRKIWRLCKGNSRVDGLL